ncbi:integrase [Nonomuraea roseola]|uniref:Integrase n=1 Tax=Nonomuraea roseola TaxID=46179 RepID=A0ABV5PUI4_9ACTN
MLARLGQLPPAAEDDLFGYEMKWDGARSLGYVHGAALRLISRNGLDVTAAYPELGRGVSARELAEYLGHADPAFTLRVYAHMMPGSHDRARHAIDSRLFKPRPTSASEEGLA